MATQSISLHTSTSSQDTRLAKGAALWTTIQAADSTELLRWTRWSMSAICLVALTYLLAPAVYGVALIAAIGMGAVRGLAPKAAISHFWTNAALGLFGAIFMAWLGGPAARYFQEPLLAAVMPAAGLFILLGRLAATSVFVLVQERRSSDLEWARLVATVAGFTLALGLAVRGMGAWSIVYGGLFYSVALLGYAWSYAPVSLRERPDVDAIGRAVWPGEDAVLASAGTLAATYLDKVLVAGALGAAALGTYQIAWAVVAYPLTYLANAVTGLVFPADRRRSDQPIAFRADCVRAARALSWICLPPMLILAVVAKPLVQTLLGATWNAAAPPLSIFAGMGAFQVLSPLVSIIYRAKGRTDLLLGSTLASGLVSTMGAAIGLRWGMAGAATGFAIGSILAVVPSLWLALGQIELGWRPLARTIWPALNISLVTGLAAYLWLTTLSVRIPTAPATLQLLSTIGIAAAVYFFLLRALRPAGMEDIEMMLARLPKPLRATREAGGRAAHAPLGELQLR